MCVYSTMSCKYNRNVLDLIYNIFGRIQPFSFSVHHITHTVASFIVLLLAQYSQRHEVEAVPPELQPLLLIALDDPVKRVQLAAAVCQYAIGTPNAHARDILRKALQHGM